MPFPNVEEAVAASLPGSTVLVCPGVHAVALNVEHDLVIEGLGDPTEVLLQGEAHRPVIAVAAGAVLEARRITVERGRRGVLAPEATVNLHDVHVQNNTAPSGEDGGGIWMQTGRLDDVVVAFNQARRGGGVFAHQLEHVSGRIDGNFAFESGAGLYVADAGVPWTLDADVMSNHAELGHGGGVFTNSALTAFGSEFDDNRSVAGSGGCVFLGATGSLFGGYLRDCVGAGGAAVGTSQGRSEPVHVQDVVVAFGWSDPGYIMELDAPAGSVVSDVNIVSSAAAAILRLRSCGDGMKLEGLGLESNWIDEGVVSLGPDCASVAIGDESAVFPGQIRYAFLSEPHGTVLYAEAQAVFELNDVRTGLDGTSSIDGGKGTMPGPTFNGVCDASGCIETP